MALRQIEVVTDSLPPNNTVETSGTTSTDDLTKIQQAKVVLIFTRKATKLLASNSGEVCGRILDDRVGRLVVLGAASTVVGEMVAGQLAIECLPLIPRFAARWAIGFGVDRTLRRVLPKRNP